MLEVRELSARYRMFDGSPIWAFERLSFKAEPGSVTLIVGPSGSGKTSLLSCLAGILTPASGSIRLGDTDVCDLDKRGLTEYRRSRVGLVFQDFNLVPSLSAFNNVVAGQLAKGMSKRAATEISLAWLDHFGLGARLHHHPHQLSSGEQQRVAIARALAGNPDLVLADEPTAHLDHASVKAVLNPLKTMANDGRIVIVATHDDRLREIADQQVEILAAHTI